MSESALAATHAGRMAPLAAVPGPHREIFGFALASSLSDSSVGYPTWDFNLLSTVAFFGLHVQDDGTLAADQGSSVWNSSQLSGLVSVAHSYGVKVVLALVLQDFTANTPHMCAGLEHGSTTVSAAVAEIKAKGVDGINLDYEGLNGSCGTSDSSWARHALTNVASSFRAAMPAGSYLSVDTYASSAADSLGFFDIPGLATAADSFFVMAYDLEYSNWARPPLNCSSFCLSPTAPLSGYYYNDTSTASQYLAAVPASKVILGVPYYGRKSCVASASPNQAPTSSVAADSYLDAVGESSASQTLPGSFVAHRDSNDPSGQEPWDTWINTSLNCTRELYIDDAISLGRKYDLVNQDNLRGVGIWTLNYGGGAPELWNALDLRFGTTTAWTGLGGVIQGRPVAVSSSPTRLDVFIRGSDNELWHRFWNGSAWSGWENLGGVLGSGPSVVALGPSRLDVFIRGQEGGLWQRTWDGTAWGGWQSLGGVLDGGPSAVGLGLSRLDVFIRGREGALWHRTWNGGAWNGWQDLGGVLTAPPTAASTSSRIDVFIRGTDNFGMWQRTSDGTSWGGWKSLGGTLPADPPAVVSTPGRIDVLVRGTDAALWGNTWNGSAWSGWSSHGGILSGAPGAASCVAGHVDVAIIGGEYAIWHLGFNGSSWAAWQRIGGLWTADPTTLCQSGTSVLQVVARDQGGAVWQTSLNAS